jgi:hypothetical protein
MPYSFRGAHTGRTIAPKPTPLDFSGHVLFNNALKVLSKIVLIACKRKIVVYKPIILNFPIIDIST